MKTVVVCLTAWALVCLLAFVPGMIVSATSTEVANDNGAFGLDLTGQDTGSVHTNLFSQYQPPDIRLAAENLDPFMTYSPVCCPPAIVGMSNLGAPINISVVGFEVDQIYPDRNGLFYWQVPDWLMEGKEQIEMSSMGVGKR